MRKLPHAMQKLPHASAGKLVKVRKIIEFYHAEAIFTVRKPCGRRAEGLWKPSGRLFRKSDLVRKLPQALIYNIAPLHPTYEIKT